MIEPTISQVPTNIFRSTCKRPSVITFDMPVHRLRYIEDIHCGPTPPDANGMIATAAHYASGDRTNGTVHRMQRAKSFMTICVRRQGSSASKNAMQLTSVNESAIAKRRADATPTYLVVSWVLHNRAVGKW